ncbi:diacylglycerol kinase [Anaeromyxobacter oryzisoli]|uniref:diacylglycerol kinase n=1 Tax=Anaeromyxobacter oryzisoli TaxID=2925408 RepID=UPI001F563F0C|nr:diacylglycerol kinase [Anaeromyxobacter sp. SG63]
MPSVPPSTPPLKGAHGVVRSFRWAWTGLVEGALRERNLRIQLAGAILVASFAAVAPLAPVERALLLLCAAAVLAAEAANSALEAVVDLAAPGLDERARIAKDCAAAAVLTLSAGAAVVLLAIALPVLPVLRAHARELAVPAAAALGTAAAAGVLPSPGSRGRGADVLFALGGVACLVPVARAATAPAGVVAAALLLLVACDAARRR